MAAHCRPKSDRGWKALWAIPSRHRPGGGPQGLPQRSLGPCARSAHRRSVAEVLVCQLPDAAARVEGGVGERQELAHVCQFVAATTIRTGEPRSAVEGAPASVDALYESWIRGGTDRRGLRPFLRDRRSRRQSE